MKSVKKGEKAMENYIGSPTFFPRKRRLAMTKRELIQFMDELVELTLLSNFKSLNSIVYFKSAEPFIYLVKSNT